MNSNLKLMVTNPLVITKTEGDHKIVLCDDDEKLMIFPNEEAAMQWMKAECWSDEEIAMITLVKYPIKEWGDVKSN